MKILTILLLLAPFFGIAQKKIHAAIPMLKAEEVKLYFKWPDQVIVKYHDSEEIIIEGEVSINYGKYDDSFMIKHSIKDDVLRIHSEVQGMDTMQHITVVHEEDGTGKVIFKNEKDKTIIQTGGHESVSTGVMMDIYLTIYLPENRAAFIESKFGLIEVKEVKGPLTAISKFGGVDITIDEREKIDLKAATSFGDIFTNLSADFRGNGELNKTGDWHRINASFAGGGRLVDVESKFGHIYLRKKE